MKLKQEWFVPHFPPREDRPLEIAMLREWKNYMSYEDYFGGEWGTRMARLLSDIPGGQNIRTARVATTVALWVVMPTGRAFFDPLLRRIQKRESEVFIHDLVLSAWAVENRLSSITVNRLESLLSDEKGLFVYKYKPYPSLPDHRAVEQTLLFLVTEEGRNLLKRVCQSCTGNWLPL